MLLVAFVTLIISVLDLYAQILSVQHSRMYHNQNMLAQIMKEWQAAALSSAITNPPTNVAVGDPDGGCWMQMGVSSMPASTEVPSACAYAGPVSFNLPPGYDTGDYSFYTILFQTADHAAYILSFVNDSDVSGFLELPGSGGHMSGFTARDLSLQFLHETGHERHMVFGSVTASSTFTAEVVQNPVGSTYTVTVPISVPVGAVGVISSAQ